MRRLAVGILLWLGPMLGSHASSLTSYVVQPDPAYNWSLRHTERNWLSQHYFLRLVSQRWLSPEQVDPTLWEHELRGAMARGPFCGRRARQSNTAILIVSGGRNKPQEQWRREPSLQASAVARVFCRPVFELKQVPNQKLQFSDESDGRKEDALLAYSIHQYLSGVDGDWPVHLAMVKSVVAAMNAIQEFAETRDELPSIEDFAVIGTSKRGWTTWLTAAIDSRVRAIIPVSIDMLNIEKQLPHHLQAYGDYSDALEDYAAYDMACALRGPRARQLLKLIDPFEYRRLIQQPKLIINASGDEFFLPDSWQFYFPALLGPKYLRYTVNVQHDQGEHAEHVELFRMAASWIDDVLGSNAIPKLSWEQQGEVLRVRSDRPPRKALVWRATNPESRDFRLETIGPAWQSQRIKPNADGVYQVLLTPPEEGWTATLVEFHYGGLWGQGQKIYTTGTYVSPSHMPYPPRDCPD